MQDWLSLSFVGSGQTLERTEYVLLKRVVPGKPLRMQDYSIDDSAEERLDKMLFNCGIIGVPEKMREIMMEAIAYERN